MKFRMKVSYSAYARKLTIIELIYKSILQTYNERKCKGLVKNPYPLNEEQKVIMKIIAGE
jgi:hypothetical protein